MRELQKSRVRATGVGLISEDALADVALTAAASSATAAGGGSGSSIGGGGSAKSLGAQFQQAENKSDVNVHMYVDACLCCSPHAF